MIVAIKLDNIYNYNTIQIYLLNSFLDRTSIDRSWLNKIR